MRPSASVVIGACATVHWAPGMLRRWSTESWAPLIGRPTSSRSVTVARAGRPYASVRLRVPDSSTWARSDALMPLFGAATLIVEVVVVVVVFVVVVEELPPGPV